VTLNISVVEHSTDPQPEPDVSTVETYLQKLGYYGGRIDGVFGDMCRGGTVSFQRHVGIADDGIVGPETLKRLKAAYDALAAGNVYSQADKMADMMYKWVTTGNDGSRPVYVWAAKPALSDNSPDKSDCSGGTSWAIGRVLGHAWVGGSRNQYAHCTHKISVAQAAKTKGALIFSTSNEREDGIHHVAVSMGNGYSAECRSSAMDCGSWKIDSRFNLAALVPELHYG
jgi:hypothetical protein